MTGGQYTLTGDLTDDEQLTLEGDTADHDKVPSRDEFVEGCILGERDPEWMYHKRDRQAYRIVDYREIHKWHFAVVLANPDGTYAKIMSFHDSNDNFLVYPPESAPYAYEDEYDEE